MRVVQRNLVYVTNLAMSIAKEDILKSTSYFGQYGKILKVVVNKNTVYQSPQGPSVSCYITYHRADEALLAIVSVDGATLQGRIVRASFGTTKYCQHFLKVYNGPLTGLPPGQTLQSSGLLNSGAVVRVTCPNPECMYLHELGPLQDSFTKEDMAMGKHLASLDPVIQHILQQAKDAPLTVSGTYKTALPPARQDLMQPLYEQMAAERVREERSALSSSSEQLTAQSANTTGSTLKTPVAKNVWKTLPPTTPVSIASTISTEKSKPLSVSMTVKPVSKPVEPVVSTSPKLSSSASLNTSEWPDLLKASAANGKDSESVTEEEEWDARPVVVETPNKKKKGAKHGANNNSGSSTTTSGGSPNNSISSASTTSHSSSTASTNNSATSTSSVSNELSASQNSSALPATARWAKKQKGDLATSSDSVSASPATTNKKHVIVVEQTESASKASETAADESWPSLTASGSAPTKEERRESRGKNKKRRDDSETSAANSSAANNSTAAPSKSESDRKKRRPSAETERKTETSAANNRPAIPDSNAVPAGVKTTAPTAVPPSKPRTVIDLDAVPGASDMSNETTPSTKTSNIAVSATPAASSEDQLQWISAHVSDLVLSDKDTSSNTAPVAPPPGTHTPAPFPGPAALTSLFPFGNNSVWTPLKGDAPTSLSSLEASLTAQPTPAQTSPRQRSRFQFANQNSASTSDAKNSNVPVASPLFNEEDLRNTFKALLPNVNISFDSNNAPTAAAGFKNDDSAVNLHSLADFPSLKTNTSGATMPPPHAAQPPHSLMAQLFAAHPMSNTPFNSAAPFNTAGPKLPYNNSSENQLNELNHTLNSLMFPAQNAPQPYPAPNAPLKQGSGTWPQNNTAVNMDSNNPLQALLGMNESIWQHKQAPSHAVSSHPSAPNTAGPSSNANTSGSANNTNSNNSAPQGTNAGLFYQQLQQLQQLQQMQQPQPPQQQQQPYYNTFQQPLVTQNLFLINQISQPGPQQMSQWPQQAAQFRGAPNTSNAASNPWGSSAPLAYPQQHQHMNNFPANIPHGFNL
jgi:hypothetical protein